MHVLYFSLPFHLSTAQPTYVRMKLRINFAVIIKKQFMKADQKTIEKKYLDIVAFSSIHLIHGYMIWYRNIKIHHMKIDSTSIFLDMDTKVFMTIYT